MMAANYNDFGPVNIQSLDTDFMSKEELMLYKKNVDNQDKQIKDGYNRIKIKIKDL